MPSQYDRHLEERRTTPTSADGGEHTGPATQSAFAPPRRRRLGRSLEAAT